MNARRTCITPLSFLIMALACLRRPHKPHVITLDAGGYLPQGVITNPRPPHGGTGIQRPHA